MKIDHRAVSVRMTAQEWDAVSGVLGPRERQVDLIRTAIRAEVDRRTRRARLSEERTERRERGGAPA